MTSRKIIQKRSIVVLSLVLAMTLSTVSAGLSAETPQKVRIAYASRSSSAIPQYMALQKGFFKAEGLDVEIIQMNPRLGATAVSMATCHSQRRLPAPFAASFRDFR
ncbi:MAG TPA: ABC transporter substrate-binding protein [Candidatus Eisenbacteria bacterium]|nr:ABC transporter substrate-binding protein [Candidatus Eisenbacteria bacterium]